MLRGAFTAGTAVAFGTVAFGTVAFGTVAFGTVAFGTVAFGTVAFGTVAFGTVAFGTVAFGTVAFGTVAFGTVAAFAPAFAVVFVLAVGVITVAGPVPVAISVVAGLIDVVVPSAGPATAAGVAADAEALRSQKSVAG